jgi:hypothetical protein
MLLRTKLVVLLAAASCLSCLVVAQLWACAPCPPSGKAVVNSDQTVIIVWDAVAQEQHFIRQASFLGEADDFGFLVPSPARPNLSESGNEAFPYLMKLTEPEIETRTRPSSGGGGCSCGPHDQTPKGGLDKGAKGVTGGGVRVLEEKLVAGFQAKVLEADSATDLVDWLKTNGYAYSAAVEAWAKPYIKEGYKFTALKMAKKADEKEGKRVAASALRISFKTKRPLFPYREPDSKSAAAVLNAPARLLRIYFIAEARYKGELTKETPWTGKVAWANQLKSEERQKTLELLKLPATTGPAEWWLTEFEDNWPYSVASADVYFSPDADQSVVKRPPIIQYVSSAWPMDVTVYAIAAWVVLPPLLRRMSLRRKK